MQIDESRSQVEISKDIWEYTINDLGVDYPFKPIGDFDKWYFKRDKYIMFPHPDINTPSTAVNSSRHPNIYVYFSGGKIGLGIAFWSVASFDENLMGIISPRNRENRDWILENFKNLKNEWDWRFFISKKKRLSNEETVFEKACAEIDQRALSDIMKKLANWRQEWAEEAKQAKKPFIVPAVNFMSTSVAPDDYDESAKMAFEVFNSLNTMIPASNLKKEWQKKRQAVVEFIVRLESRLSTSNYPDAIKKRIVEQGQLLAEIDREYGEGN